MTEKPFCVISKQSNNDYERYSKGKFTLEEWEDVNYCEHCFSMDDEGLNDKEVVDLLNSLSEENEQLKQQLQKYYDTTNADGKQIISDLVDSFEINGVNIDWFDKGDVE